MRAIFARALLGAAFGVDIAARGQQPEQPPPTPGTVLFQRDVQPDFQRDEKPAPDSDPQHSPAEPPDPWAVLPPAAPPSARPDVDIAVTNEERDAITFTAYDLDLHLTPATSTIEARVNFTVRNDGKQPLTQLPLQLSSSLAWEGLRVRSGPPAAFAQHRVDTDADHTGAAREAVLALSTPLAPGASLDLTAFYSGTIPPFSERLQRIGAPADQAAAADWDAIGQAGTGLRGYGNVLWYPVASAPAFLGDGAKLFDSVGNTRLRQQTATVRLRLTICYTGEAPDAAFFDGRREPLTALSENPDVPTAESTGVATAEFPARPLGFRVPSLFVTDRAATVTGDALIRAVTDQSAVLGQYAAAAEKVRPLLVEWLGPPPPGQLDILDHPGQPFEDDGFLVTPLQAGEVATLTPVLVHTLAHTWFRSSRPWLDEGVAQFLSLLWVEANDGRQEAIDRLQAALPALGLVEPVIPASTSVADGAAASPPLGQTLIAPRSEVYFRTKAAAVLWMLRSIAGDEALKAALLHYRHNPAADAAPDGFEKLLEQASHQDLKWFFDDWVYQDRGLPDLAIANVSTRPTPDKGGKSGGWLVAIDVRNNGDAVAEVPVTVRSGTLTATERLRIPGRSNAATRILFQGTPEEVIVNDGSVPEQGDGLHIKRVVARPE